MKAPVIWLTGIPGSGKTTLAEKLQKHYQQDGLPVEILDGDEIRKTLSKDLGFSPEDRKEHNRRGTNSCKKWSYYHHPTYFSI